MFRWTFRITFVLAAAALAAAALFSVLSPEVLRAPAFPEVKASFKRSDAVLLDRHGEVIHELRVDNRNRRLDWTGLRDISPALTRAVIRAEDRRYYSHHGVDWTAVTGAMIRNMIRSGQRGASTITMQLASVLDKRLKPTGRKRSWSKKVLQIRDAFEIEKAWDKERVLEAYLNLITYRGELQGIAAASRGLFDKDPSGLNDTESAILASLIVSPNAPLNGVISRACLLGKAALSPVSCDDVTSTAHERLGAAYGIRPPVSLAPHAARMLLTGTRRTVKSTLDGSLQRFAYETLNQYLSSLKDRNVFDGAVLVAENRSGEILAYVGNSGAGSSAVFVDGISAGRQAGSTLKPLLYELAVERGLLTPASILDDSPMGVATSSGLYVPKNYDNGFKGSVSVRTALSSSLNIPAVRTLQLVGPSAFVERLRSLGFGGLTEGPEYYGYSLALGSAEVSLYELLNAYRTLANGGVRGPLSLTPAPTFKSRRVTDKNATFLIASILSDREARSVTFGLENPLATRFWTAVKTGTSKDMRDNWCIGYSEKYTVGVWVGNFSGEPMRDVSGVTGAAPIWLEIMNYLHQGTPSRPPRPPSGVVSGMVSFDHEIEPRREEWFIKGSEPKAEIKVNTTYEKPHITYPIDEMIINMDPEIPEGLQLVLFEMRPVGSGLEWMLNERKLGDTSEPLLWAPEQGSYTLSLVDNQHRVMDAVRFSVR